LEIPACAGMTLNNQVMFLLATLKKKHSLNSLVSLQSQVEWALPIFDFPDFQASQRWAEPILKCSQFPGVLL
jgi:hypothetical protein